MQMQMGGRIDGKQVSSVPTGSHSSDTGGQVGDGLRRRGPNSPSSSLRSPDKSEGSHGCVAAIAPHEQRPWSIKFKALLFLAGAGAAFSGLVFSQRSSDTGLRLMGHTLPSGSDGFLPYHVDFKGLDERSVAGMDSFDPVAKIVNSALNNTHGSFVVPVHAVRAGVGVLKPCMIEPLDNRPPKPLLPSMAEKGCVKHSCKMGSMTSIVAREGKFNPDSNNFRRVTETVENLRGEVRVVTSDQLPGLRHKVNAAIKDVIGIEGAWTKPINPETFALAQISAFAADATWMQKFKDIPKLPLTWNGTGENRGQQVPAIILEGHRFSVDRRPVYMIPTAIRDYRAWVFPMDQFEYVEARDIAEHSQEYLSVVDEGTDVHLHIPTVDLETRLSHVYEEASLSRDMSACAVDGDMLEVTDSPAVGRLRFDEEGLSMSGVMISTVVGLSAQEPPVPEDMVPVDENFWLLTTAPTYEVIGVAAIR